MEHPKLQSKLPLVKPESERIWNDPFSDTGKTLPIPLADDKHVFDIPQPSDPVVYPPLEFGLELLSPATEDQSSDFFENLPDLDSNFLELKFTEEITTPICNRWPLKNPKELSYHLWTDNRLTPPSSSSELFSTITATKSLDSLANLSDVDTSFVVSKCSEEISSSSSNQRSPKTPEAFEVSKEIPVTEKSSSKCIDNQMTPMTPSSSSSELKLLPYPTFSCYSNLSTQFIGNVFFFIDSGREIACRSPSMKITVLDPNNCQVPVQISRENVQFAPQFVCTFSACILGSYTVSVFDGLLKFPVKGSPLIIPVSRNYKIIPRPLILSDEVKRAWGIAYSPFSNRVYVTGRYSNQIFIFHQDGSLDKSFRGCGPRGFRRPTGIAVDNLKQRLIISDKDNHQICIYTLDGRFLFCFGQKGHINGQLSYPWGVAVSPKDSFIVVADSRNHRLQIFDSNGKFLRKYSVFESNPFDYKTEFNYPRGICFDKTGDNIYVTDFNANSVWKLNIDLTEKKQIRLPAALLYRPQGIAIDHVGNLLICDTNCIRVISPKGEPVATIYGHQMDSFWHPMDLVVTPTGQIIVVDLIAKIWIV